MTDSFGVGAVTLRVLSRDEATAVIHLAVGTGAAARWRGRPDVSEVVTADPRTPTERREFTELKTTVITRLKETPRRSR